MLTPVRAPRKGQKAGLPGSCPVGCDPSTEFSASKPHLSRLQFKESCRCHSQLGEVAAGCLHSNWTGTSKSSNLCIRFAWGKSLPTCQSGTREP